MIGNYFKFLGFLPFIVFAGCSSPSTSLHQAGISQYVETRGGRLSVWGVDIQLDRLSFQTEITNDQISIQESKHGQDLRDIMEWAVSEDHKTLRIRFRSGMGDFGTGNGVTVFVDVKAIDGYLGIDNRLEWSISTDVQ